MPCISDDSTGSKCKRVYTNSPNLELLTKIAIPGEIQLTDVYVSVGNNSLGETVNDFALIRSFNASTVV